MSVPGISQGEIKLKKILTVLAAMLLVSAVHADALLERTCRLDFDRCMKHFDHCQGDVQKVDQCRRNNERCREHASRQYKTCVQETTAKYDNCVHLNRREHKASRICDRYNVNNCKGESQVCPQYGSCGQIPACGPVKERCDVNYQICMRNAKAQSHAPQQAPTQPVYQPPSQPQTNTITTPRYEQPAAVSAPQTLNTREQVMALSKAVGEEQYAEVNRLLQQGVAVNSPDKNNSYPICYAASLEQDNSRFTRILLDVGARVNVRCTLILHRSNGRIHGERVNLTVLQVAVQKGNLAIARMLLDSGADVKQTAGTRGGVLHIAAMNGDLEMVRLLLKHRADINDFNKYQGMALDTVDYKKHPAMADFLIENGTDKNRVLLYGAKNGVLPIVKKILRKGADINATDHSKQTALIWAIKLQHKDVVDYLLSKKANVNLLDNVRDFGSRNALYHAIEMKQEDVIAKLIKRGASISTQINNQFPIFEAISRKLSFKTVVSLYPNNKDKGWSQQHRDQVLIDAIDNYEDINVIKFLVNKRANINAEHGAPLKQALANKNPEVARYLLAKGANRKLTKGKDGATLIELSASSRSPENIKLAYSLSPELPTEAGQFKLLCHTDKADIIDLYMQYGFNINASRYQREDPGADTAIVCALGNRNMEVFKALLKHKADVRYNVRTQNVTFDYAINNSSDRIEFLDELIKHGADVNFQNPKNGYTPLHKAVERLKANAIKLLLQAGADKTRLNIDGKTPYELARRQKASAEILTLLQ